MKNKLTDWMKNKSGRSPYHFTAEELTESVEELHNPGCGLYQMYTLVVDQEPDLENLRWCMAYPLVLVFFQIGHYRKRPLDEDAIRHMSCVLEELRKAGKDVILRIAYDNTGKGLEHEPDTFDRVLEHMESLAPLLRAYAPCIYILQGLFVGSWGEMHTSRYLSAEKLARLEKKLRQCAGEGTYLAFRRPVQYRRIYSSILPESSIGIFDDGILGSAENLGTFGTQPQKQSGWENPWAREEELQFLSELARYAPIGGEAVLGDHAAYPYTLSDTVDLLKKMHLSYLNSTYDSRVHAAWEKLEFRGRGPWKGMNGKDYITRHLGYRYRVKAARCSLEQDTLHVSVTVVNDGFSRAYRPIRPYIQIGEQKTYLACDLKDLPPGEQCVLQGSVPCHPGDVLLGASWEKADGTGSGMPGQQSEPGGETQVREVRFANGGTVDGKVLLGRV